MNSRPHRARSLAGAAAIALIGGLTVAAPATQAAAPVTSTTTVVAAPASAAYGAAIDVTATVAAAPEKPMGEVVFTVAGKTVNAPVKPNDGTASAKLPVPLPVGTYELVATYTPKDAAAIAPSAGTTSLIVVKDATQVTVDAPSVTKPNPIVAAIAVTSTNGETVTGQVQVRLYKKGVLIKTKLKTLDAQAKATAKFAKLKPARYKVRVKYLGSANFKRDGAKTYSKVLR